MDGTLLGSDGRVSPRNQRALCRAEAAGIHIVVATGRRYCYAMKVLSALGLRQESVLVTANGAVVRTVGAQLLHRTEMPLPTARRLCAYMNEFRDTLVMTFDRVGPDGQDERGALAVEDLATLEASIERWVKVNASAIAEIKPLENALAEGPPIQMMVCGPIARMREAEIRLTELPHVTAVGAAVLDGAEVTLHRTEYADKDLCILDILPAGCSKAGALATTAARWGIAMREVMAIGDNWNDVPMLREAGRAVLMANASEDLKAMAATMGWDLGRSNDDDGVAIAVEEILAERAVEQSVEHRYSHAAQSC